MAIKRTAPKPPVRPAADNLRESFIAAAATAGEVEKKVEHPWTNATNIAVTLNTRIPHHVAVKLEWLKDKRGIPKSAAVEEALSAWIDAEFQRLGVREDD